MQVDSDEEGVSCLDESHGESAADEQDTETGYGNNTAHHDTTLSVCDMLEDEVNLRPQEFVRGSPDDQ